MDDRSQGRDVTCVTEVLMPDDGFTHRLRLRHFTFQRLQQVVRNDTALELERQLCAALIVRCGADVVEQGSEKKGLVATLPVWEVLRGDRLAWQEVSKCSRVQMRR